MSISGKSTADWEAIATELAPIELITEPVLVKKRSRDFFWYSPVLNAQLRRAFGDLVALPATEQELATCLAVAYRHDLPVTLRGGGTGNYGQAVPLDGGLIIETTRLNKIIEIGDGWITAQAGAKMADLNAALAERGQEMAIFPSTQDIATIGGFVGGGSSGIGSVAHGMLRDPGNLIRLKALSLEDTPQTHIFEGDDVNQIHHAWGMNGAITEVTLRTVPHCDWIGTMATFDTYEAAYAAGHALASSDLEVKLVSTVDARITEYFPRLQGHIRAQKHLMVSLVAPNAAAGAKDFLTELGAHVDLMMTDAEREAANIPHVFEFSYNHTTLQVLKSDRSATYQQFGCPTPPDPAKIKALRADLNDDCWMHHEFARLDGAIVSFDLPIIWYKDEDQRRGIEATYEKHGFPVYDAHISMVEGGGLKSADYRHLAWKKRLDPKGLMNSAKSREWANVAHLSPDEIEALGPQGGSA